MIFEFDQFTLSVLKTFAGINPSIYIRAGNFIETISPSFTMYAYANLSVPFPYSFAIYDLNQFLTCLSMFERPQLDFGNKSVKIYEFENKHKNITYIYTEPNCVIYPPEEKMFDEQEIITSFHLKNDSLKDLLKALSILKIEDMAFVGDGENVYIKALDTKKHSSTFSDKVGSTEKIFSAVIKSDNLRMMKVNYKVDISKMFAKFSSGSEDIVFYVALENNSEFK